MRTLGKYNDFNVVPWVQALCSSRSQTSRHAIYSRYFTNTVLVHVHQSKILLLLNLGTRRKEYTLNVDVQRVAQCTTDIVRCIAYS